MKNEIKIPLSVWKDRYDKAMRLIDVCPMRIEELSKEFNEYFLKIEKSLPYGAHIAFCRLGYDIQRGCELQKILEGNL